MRMVKRTRKEQSTIPVGADSLARTQFYEKRFELPYLPPAVDAVQGRQDIGIQRLTALGSHGRE